MKTKVKFNVVCCLWLISFACVSAAGLSWGGSLTGSGFDVITNSSGTTAALSLSTTISTGSGDVNQAGKIFIIGSYGNQYFLLTEQNRWVNYIGGEVQSYKNGALPAQTTVTFLTGQDVSSLVGLSLYAGYGSSFEEMAAAKRYKLLYTIPSNLTGTPGTPGTPGPTGPTGSTGSTTGSITIKW
ncbi:MAG TPA: hypothetical protein HPP76_11580 [Desulfuromonadales bacterium]|nr:hypothetical protein [Desulfuromonadales bacterium]